MDRRLVAPLALALAMLAAGCASPRGNEVDAALALPGDAPAWDGAPLALPLPEGDSFGVLRLSNLTPQDHEGATLYGLVVDPRALAGTTRVEIYRIDGGTLTTDGATAESGTFDGIRALGWEEDPGEILVLVIAHATRAGEVLVGQWGDDELSIVGTTTPATWLATGPAAVSYYRSGIFVNQLAIEDVSYGFSVGGTGAPPNGLAAAGLLTFTSAHEESGAATIELASATLIVTGAGAGTLETTLAAGDAEHAVSVAFVGPARAGVVSPYAGAAMRVAAEGASTFEVALSGGAALQSLRLDHFSAPVDLATLGLTLEDVVEETGTPVPLR